MTFSDFEKESLHQLSVSCLLVCCFFVSFLGLVLVLFVNCFCLLLVIFICCLSMCIYLHVWLLQSLSLHRLLSVFLSSIFQLHCQTLTLV